MVNAHLLGYGEVIGSFEEASHDLTMASIELLRFPSLRRGLTVLLLSSGSSGRHVTEEGFQVTAWYGCGLSGFRTGWRLVSVGPARGWRTNVYGAFEGLI
jgi:hypothetical protein